MKFYSLIALTASVSAIKITSMEATEVSEDRWRKDVQPAWAKNPPPEDCQAGVKEAAEKLWNDKVSKGKNSFWKKFWFDKAFSSLADKGVTWEACAAQPAYDGCYNCRAGQNWDSKTNTMKRCNVSNIYKTLLDNC